MIKKTFICRDCLIEQPIAYAWDQSDCESCGGEGIDITGDVCDDCDQGVTRSCEDCSRPTRIVVDEDESGLHEREVFA